MPRNRVSLAAEPLGDRCQPTVLNYGGPVLPHVEVSEAVTDPDGN